VAAPDEARSEVVDLPLGTSGDVRPEEGVREKDVHDVVSREGGIAEGTLHPSSADDEEPPVTTAPPVLDLTGEHTPVPVLLRDLWGHRDLVTMLARQDYRSRYRSASLGLLWAVALPMLQGLVIAIVFSQLTGGGVTKVYVPYVICGVTAYGYVSSSLTASSTSIVDSASIAGRIYFPRLVLPTVAPTANLPGAAISLALALVVSLSTGSRPGLWLLLTPFAVALAWALVVSAGALLAMLHVYSRDVRYIVQAGMLVLFYGTPVIYFLEPLKGARALPDNLVPFVLANPVTGVVQLVRQCLTGQAAYLGEAVAVTGGWIVVLLALTLMSYSRRERVACDRL
jgi:ABC-type polysaccharide/polyol phosphate export permease